MVLIPLTRVECFNDDVIVLQGPHPHGSELMTLVLLKPSNYFAIETKRTLGCDVHSTKPIENTLYHWSPVLYDVTENFLTYAIEYLDVKTGQVKREEARKVFITTCLPPFSAANKITFCLKSSETPFHRVSIGGIIAKYSPIGSDSDITRGSITFLTADSYHLIHIEMIAPGRGRVWEYLERNLLEFPIHDPTWQLPKNRVFNSEPMYYTDVYKTDSQSSQE